MMLDNLFEYKHTMSYLVEDNYVLTDLALVKIIIFI